ncbi:ankyrin repeat domain-containing protein [bacterium]|nr:ankyrin repeat domain-containing protein [bacterium]
MPWSASVLFAPALPQLRQAWLQHPALVRGLHCFPRLPYCQLPAAGLLAVPEFLPPESCRRAHQIPWDVLQPGRRFQPTLAADHQPPPQLLAALSQMSSLGPLLFYRGETHGGELIEEESWVFESGKIERYRKNPLVSGMAALGATLPEGGWFEPFTSQFDWGPFFLGVPGSLPTPGSLYQACHSADWVQAKALLEQGHHATGYGNPNPMTWALRSDHLEMARLLHAQGHPLSWSELCECRSAEAVLWMLQEGTQSRPQCGLALLERGCLEAWRALGDQHPPQEVFLAACYGGVAELVGPLLEQHPEWLHLSRMGDDPLTMAARRGDSKLCALLIGHGASWHESALYEAAAHGHLHLVQAAIQAGVSPLARRWGRSALAEAACRGHLSVLQGLPGVDLNAPDQYGRTPLQAAALAGQEGVVEWLLQRGVELESKDQSGCTALWSAVASGRQSLVDRLLRAGANPDVQNAYGDSLALLASQRQIQLPARQPTTEKTALQSDHQE